VYYKARYRTHRPTGDTPRDGIPRQENIAETLHVGLRSLQRRLNNIHDEWHDEPESDQE